MSEHDVGRLIGNRRNGLPEENPVIVGVGHHQNVPVGSDHGWVTEAALGEIRVGGGGEIGLAEHQTGLAYARRSNADRAAAALGNFVGRTVDELRDIVIDQDPIVYWRYQSVQIGIDDEQSVVGECQPLHRADLIRRRLARALEGKRGLTDNLPGRLSS